MTTGQAASGFTSTRMDIVTDNSLRQLSDDEVRKADFHQTVRSRQLKGRVVLVTNKGPLQVEIEADRVPKTAENFLELCEQGYYNDTKFHRLIKGFMVRLGFTEVTYLCCRYREATLRARGEAASPISLAERSSRTSSIQRYRTWAEASCQWPTADQTQMEANCKVIKIG